MIKTITTEAQHAALLEIHKRVAKTLAPYFWELIRAQDREKKLEGGNANGNQS